MDDLKNRIKKKFAHLKKWAKRENITCFRVYERDLENYPLIIDWFDGDAVCWLYDRKRDDTDVKKEQYKTKVSDTICQGLDISDAYLYLKSRRKQKGVAQYEKISQLNNTKIVAEGGLKFEINLTDYLDTGLFLDHRKTRDLCRNLAKGKRFLNLFSYTGSFTCYAIDGGAISTTTVDLNTRYSDWAEQNLALNGFEKRRSDRIITDNCLSFVKLDAAKNRYDLIFCDPPTFSNSKKMKTAFSVDSDYPDLIKSCIKLLSPGGTLIFSTNSRSFKLDETKLPSSIKIENITKKTISEDFKTVKSHQCFLIQSL